MTKKPLKIGVLIGLLVLTVYLFYGIVGSIYAWRSQPLFVSDGVSSRSYGFLVVGCVFAVLFVIALALDILYWYFLFLRARRVEQRQLQSGKA